MSKWQDIWNKRELSVDSSILDGLIRADGFDIGAGRVREEDWRKWVERIKLSTGFKQDNTIFEVGCGSGAFLYPFYEQGSLVAGIDFSEAQVNIAKKVMPEMNFSVSEAIALTTEEKYDFVVSNGAFHYFPNLNYAEEVIVKMLKKSNKQIMILDIPDRDLKDQSEKIRRGTLSDGEYDKKYSGLGHLYYDREWFKEVGNKHNFDVRVFNQDMENYGNNDFRFNVVMTKDSETIG